MMHPSMMMPPMDPMMPPMLPPGLHLPPSQQLQVDPKQDVPPDGPEADGSRRKQREKKTSMQRIASRLRDMPAPKPSRKQGSYEVACMAKRIMLTI